MTAEPLVISLYIGLTFSVVFLPLRWSLIAYLLLSTIDFGQKSEHIGLLNTGKAIILPLFLLWRLRYYSGHKRIALASIAWILLTIYAAIGAFWSYYPVFALKLTGHMIASFVICCVFLRASKAALIDSTMALPVVTGALAIATLRSVFAPGYGDESARFTTFSTAQSFGAFLVAMYCIVLCAKTLRPAIRIPLCAIIITALVFDGSRIWALGLLTATLFALLISDVRYWLKSCVVGIVIILTSLIIGSTDKIIDFLSAHASSNRIASAIAAAYQGDVASTGLGTFRFRRGLTERVVDQLMKSSTVELLIGHGTSSGTVILGSSNKGSDPNRFFHNEWLRVAYEWGIMGLILFFLFIGSIATFAFRGFRRESSGYAKPLLVFLPAFLLGLTGENIIAGAGNAVSVGFTVLVALASVAYRQPRSRMLADAPLPLRESELRFRNGRMPQENWAAPNL